MHGSLPGFLTRSGVLILLDAVTLEQTIKALEGGVSPNRRRDLKRLRDALADVVRLEEGWRPAQQDLGEAPSLSPWAPTAECPTRLIGSVTAHPTITDGFATTSPLVAMDAAEFAWARTVSRFYRLGEPLLTDAGSGLISRYH